MIHARPQASYYNSDAEVQEESILHISLVSLPTLKKFQELLNRSLNCAPEFGDEWFQLSDRLATFIASEESRLPPV